MNVNGTGPPGVAVHVVCGEYPRQRSTLQEVVDTGGLGVNVNGGLWAREDTRHDG